MMLMLLRVSTVWVGSVHPMRLPCCYSIAMNVLLPLLLNLLIVLLGSSWVVHRMRCDSGGAEG